MVTMIASLLFNAGAHADRGERTAVEETIRAWVHATDRRDADAVGRVFLPSAVQQVTMGEQQLALTTEAYLGMIRDGKIGGGETALSIHSVQIEDQLATALTTRKGAKMVMKDALVLERTGEGWQIAGAAVHASPR